MSADPSDTSRQLTFVNNCISFARADLRERACPGPSVSSLRPEKFALHIEMVYHPAGARDTLARPARDTRDSTWADLSHPAAIPPREIRRLPQAPTAPGARTRSGLRTSQRNKSWAQSRRLASADRCGGDISPRLTLRGVFANQALLTGARTALGPRRWGSAPGQGSTPARGFSAD
jgi:hypothetical protein